MMRFTDVKEVKTIYQVSVAETKTSPQTFRCLRSNSWNKRRDLCTKKRKSYSHVYKNDSQLCCCFMGQCVVAGQPLTPDL